MFIHERGKKILWIGIVKKYLVQYCTFYYSRCHYKNYQRDNYRTIVQTDEKKPTLIINCYNSTTDKNSGFYILLLIYFNFEAKNSRSRGIGRGSLIGGKKYRPMPRKIRYVFCNITITILIVMIHAKFDERLSIIIYTCISVWNVRVPLTIDGHDNSMCW